MGLIEEARKWFREGTRSIRGKGSHALWHAWATLEAEKVSSLICFFDCVSSVSLSWGERIKDRRKAA